MKPSLGAVEFVKWLAFVAMVFDHVDLLLFDRSIPWMHEIGRFALPAFAVTFGIGLARSRDALSVAARLALPAIIAQVGWVVAGQVEHPANILFTFCLCALVLAVVRADRAWGYLLAVFVVAASPLLEGGALTLLLVFGGWWARAAGARWPHLVAGLPWFGFLITPGTLLGLLAPHICSRSRFDLPRSPGLLAWAYPAHLSILALLVVALGRG